MGHMVVDPWSEVWASRLSPGVYDVRRASAHWGRILRAHATYLGCGLLPRTNASISARVRQTSQLIGAGKSRLL